MIGIPRNGVEKRFILAGHKNSKQWLSVLSCGSTYDNLMGLLTQCSFKLQQNDRSGSKTNLVQKIGNNVIQESQALDG